MNKQRFAPKLSAQALAETKVAFMRHMKNKGIYKPFRILQVSGDVVKVYDAETLTLVRIEDAETIRRDYSPKAW